MCGIVALYASGPVNQRLYDALLLLQPEGPIKAVISFLLKEREIFFNTCFEP